MRVVRVDVPTLRRRTSAAGVVQLQFAKGVHFNGPAGYPMHPNRRVADDGFAAMRSTLAAACVLVCGCGGTDDPCDADKGAILVAYVRVHVHDATSGKPLTAADGGSPNEPDGTLSLACAGFPLQTAKSWGNPIVLFVDPGPHEATVHCTVSVTLPGYLPWTQEVDQVYGKCGYGTKGFDLQVDLQPAK